MQNIFYHCYSSLWLLTCSVPDSLNQCWPVANHIFKTMLKTQIVLFMTSQWRHNERNGASTHACIHCLLSFASLAFWGESIGDRWIPLTKGQERGKCINLMTSSCNRNISEDTKKSEHFRRLVDKPVVSNKHIFMIIHLFVFIWANATMDIFTNTFSTWKDVWISCDSSHWYMFPGVNLLTWINLTHWGRDKMVAVSQMTLSNAFSWMKC